MIDPRIPEIVYRELLQPRAVTFVQAMPPGMSGASVFECASLGGVRFALKCWPEKTKATRVDEVHRIVTLARTKGCSLVPGIHASATGASYVASSNRYWELLDWVVGHPLAGDAPLEKIAAGAESIAKFHQSARAAGTMLQKAPAVQSRLQRRQTLDRILPDVFDLDIRSIDAEPLAEVISDARQLVRSRWAEVSLQITQSLAIYLDADADVETQYVLRDVHRDHVFFDEDRVTGLIDFDALRIDTPATDLSRWAGSFLAGHADESAVWDATMAGYRAHCPFSEKSEQMAKGLSWATVWISLANWIVWILAEKRRFAADNHLVATRVNELSQLARR